MNKPKTIKEKCDEICEDTQGLIRTDLLLNTDHTAELEAKFGVFSENVSGKIQEGVLEDIP